MKFLNRKITAAFIAIAACGCTGADGHTTDPNARPAQIADSVAPTAAPTGVYQASSADTILTFAFAGDIMMGSDYPEPQLTADDGAGIFTDVQSVLSSADIAAANLEGVLASPDEGEPKKCFNPNTCFTFRMPPRYTRHLTDAGIDFVSVANNHADDFGPEGRKATHRYLDRAGLAYAGQRDGHTTAMINRKGLKVGFAAFGHSTGTPSIMDYDEVRQIVGSLDSVCDIVVVSFHGGAEGAKHSHVPHVMETFLGAPRGDVEAFAHTAVDAGADIVYGHGPHVTRAMELYGDRLIMYSLGNFATPYGMNLNGINSHAPVVEVNIRPDGTFIDGQIHPFIQTKGVGPRHDTTETVVRQIISLTAADFPSTPLRISPTGAISR